MLKKLTKENRGFTIIEVLIVLAIAGLIMLIVFLAVPALQRNSRNNTYRNDASQLMAAAQEWSNNNNGATPVLANAGAIDSLAKKKNPGFFIVEAETGTTVPTAIPGQVVVLRTGARCNANQDSTDPGPSRSFALLYAVENSSGASTPQCLNS